ncbi:MAG: tyrosine-type recombinase/integrase [Isosphaeraceae bacterium]
MGRPRKQNREPFWRTERDCWYVHVAGRQIRLSPDKDEAWRLWHELMAKPPEPERPVAPGPDIQVIEVLDAFLDWCQRHKAARTYDWYRDFFCHLVGTLPAALRVVELKAHHLTRAMDAKPDWSNNTRNDFVSAVKRAFNWALDEELIERNPIARAKKPARETREIAVLPSEYAAITEAIREPNFRDLIELGWESGMRPQEIRKIEARMFDPGNSRIIFPPREAKGKKYYRIIYLTPRAKEIVARLAEQRPHGPLLVNSEGKPWTKDAINCAFRRLRVTLGLQIMQANGENIEKVPRFRKWEVEPERLAEARREHREKLKQRRKEIRNRALELSKRFHFGAFRKGYATEALKAGLDTVTLAHLLGHRDPSMVIKIYGQVQNDPAHMASAALRAKRNRAAGP